ncbi:MAG: hypothetical protein AAGC56_01195 [Pseudomonadota bacterium]
MRLLSAILVAAVVLAALSGHAHAQNERKSRSTLDPSQSVILFGGVGFLEEGAQNALFRLLIKERDEGVAMINAGADGVVARINAQGGLPTLSPHPIAMNDVDAKATLQRVFGDEPAPRFALRSIEEHFDNVYALYVIGSFEHHESGRFKLADEKTGPVYVYNDFFTVYVSAVLIDLKTNEVVLSTSALGQDRIKNGSAPVAKSKHDDHFSKAYELAVEKSLTRFVTLASKKKLRSLKRRTDRHIVTGAWLHGDEAHGRFRWRQPPPSADACRINTGCERGDANCNAVMGLLVHGLTDALSAAGKSTIPPLNWSEWRVDNSYEVGVKIGLAFGRGTLIGDQQIVRLDPRAAQYKHVANLWLGREPERRSPVVVEDVHYALLSDKTYFNRRGDCGVDERPNDESVEVVGEYGFPRPSGQNGAGDEMRGFFYRIAIIDALIRIEDEL